MQPAYKEIGKRIKEARIKAGFSRQEIAEIVNASSSHVANIENGKKPSLEYLLSFSYKCNVSIDWLMCRTNSHLEVDDENLNEIIKIYTSSSIDAKRILFGVFKTIIQNSNESKEITSSTSKQNGKNGASNIA